LQLYNPFCKSHTSLNCPSLSSHRYSGSLDISKVTHVVTLAGPGSPLPNLATLSEKLDRAMEACIPIVSFEWLLKSAAAGQFLPAHPYLVAQPITLTSGPPTAESCMQSPNVEVGSTSPVPTPPSVEMLRCTVEMAFEPSEAHGHAKNLQFLHGEALTPIREEDGGRDALIPKKRTEAKLQSGCLHDVLQDLPSPQQVLQASTVAVVHENALYESAISALAAKAHHHRSNPHRLIDACTPSADSKEHVCSTSREGKPKPQDTDSVDLQPSPSALALLPISVVAAGPPLSKRVPPSQQTIDGLKAHHGHATRASFYQSATVELPSGKCLTFTIGEMCHAAKMLYDVDPVTGKRMYARALVRSIYTLPSCPDEVWMEHHYFLDEKDVNERPSWQAALKGTPIKHGEVLLTAGRYFSPMHLICEEFGVWLELEAKDMKRIMTSDMDQNPMSKGYFPVYLCRRALDTMAATAAPLKKVLGNGLA
jgi:hypothetical protein